MARCCWPELLIKRPANAKDGKTTIYLGSTEVVVTQATTGTLKSFTTEGRRYYSHPAGTVAVRTAKPGAGTVLSFLTADPHGTSSATIRATTMEAKKRYTDPFGNNRGGVESSVDDKGFLGKPNDPDTEITHIGAREYDPQTGRFLSLDPIMDTTDGQSLNGYTYSNSDPVNKTDPTGLQYMDNGARQTGNGRSAQPLPQTSTNITTEPNPIVAFYQNPIANPMPRLEAPGPSALDRFLGWIASNAPRNHYEVRTQIGSGATLAAIDLGEEIAELESHGRYDSDIVSESAEKAMIRAKINTRGPVALTARVVAPAAIPIPGVGPAIAAARVVRSGGLLKAANAARDARLAELAAGSARQRNEHSVVVGAYNIRTREVAAGVSSKLLGECAEACALRMLGGNIDEVRFTIALRPRGSGQRATVRRVCERCEQAYGRGSFPDPATAYDSDLLRNR